MNLHEQLDRSLDEHADVDRLDLDRLDLDRLARVARRDGTRRRRRRTVGVTVLGTVAAAAVLGVVGVSLGGPHPDRGTALAAEVPPPPGPDGPAVPATQRGVVAALAWAVSQEESGTTSGYQGQGGTASVVDDLFGTFTWEDADGAGAALVQINVQFEAGMFSSCEDGTLTDCHESTLPSGDRIATGQETSQVAEGTRVDRVVDLLRTDGVRVAVVASNGLAMSGDHWDITRPEPPLTVAQLRDVAEQSFWGHQLPQSFVSAGDDLTPYVDIDARQAREIPPPTAAASPQ